MSEPFGRVGPVFSVGCRLTAESGLPRWWPYNFKHDEGRGSPPRPSSTLRGTALVIETTTVLSNRRNNGAPTFASTL